MPEGHSLELAARRLAPIVGQHGAGRPPGRRGGDRDRGPRQASPDPRRRRSQRRCSPGYARPRSATRPGQRAHHARAAPRGDANQCGRCGAGRHHPHRPQRPASGAWPRSAARPLRHASVSAPGAADRAAGGRNAARPAGARGHRQHRSLRGAAHRGGRSVRVGGSALGSNAAAAGGCARERCFGPASTTAEGSSSRVYRRAGRPCPRCGDAIASRPVGEQRRRLYWCPGCQVRAG